MKKRPTMADVYLTIARLKSEISFTVRPTCIRNSFDLVEFLC